MTNTSTLHGALAEQVLAHLPMLRARAAGLSRSACDAEDLVQDTIERALRKSVVFRDPPHVARWLMRVMYNLFADRWRRRSRIKALTPREEGRLASPAPYEPSPWEMLTESDVQRAMIHLPPVMREIVRMSVLEKRTYKDISQRVGIPIPTVGTRLHRARMRMKQLLSAPVAPRFGERRAKSAPLRRASPRRVSVARVAS